MRNYYGFWLVPALFALGLAACSQERAAPPAGAGAPLAPAALSSTSTPATSDANAPKTSRKVIRSAELSLEVVSPAETEAKVSELVERLGGYVAASERDRHAGEAEREETRVTLSLRVPSERLDEALRELKRLGRGDESEKIGSEDVTDEYIDVDARVANQRRLEQQLGALLTQTNNVESALKIHQELAAVRTEIDRMEGRKRFLERESALAKISLSLSTLRPVVSTTAGALGVSVRRAASDAADVAVGLVTFGIRALGVLVPLSAVFVPALLLVRLWLRRRRRLALVAG